MGYHAGRIDTKLDAGYTSLAFENVFIFLETAMRIIEFPEITATGATQGVPVEGENITLYTYQNTGAFSYTAQASHNGLVWFNVGSAISALGVTVLAGKIKFLRLNVGTVGSSLRVAMAV